MTFTFGSLFSGIGGIDLGLERAGMTCRWQVEVDEYCRKVLAKHWPSVPKYGDIRTITGNELERVDLIAGGFPCQDVSLAGKRAGLAGERSGLWSEYRRLLGVLRPRYVLIENVPGLFTAGLDRVLADLAALGFDAEWTTLRASDFGAPHRRERVFVVAYAQRVQGGEQNGADLLGGWSDEAQQVGLGGINMADANRQRPGETRQFLDREEERITSSSESVAYSAGHGRREGRAESDRRWAAFAREPSVSLGATNRRRCQQCYSHERAISVPFPPGPDEAAGWRDYLVRYPTLEPSFCSGTHGLPAGLVRNRVAQLKAYGNAVVPQVAEWVGRRILNAAGHAALGG
jgi:DNA (cytosine-5)-methyltransferase 1